MTVPRRGDTHGNTLQGCTIRLSQSGLYFDQKMSFSTAVFKPGFQNPHLFLDIEEVTKCNIHVYIIGENVIVT